MIMRLHLKENGNQMKSNENNNKKKIAYESIDINHDAECT